MVLVIDNYDSFTYNLVQYLGICGEDPLVRRNDEISLSEILQLRPDGIMLSPGPCTPRESGVCLDILGAAFASEGESKESKEGEGPGFSLARVPIFGVCLGHQAIGHVAGSPVVQARKIMHGKASSIRHDEQGLFEGMPNPFRAIRYHSLVITQGSLPPGFEVCAAAEDDGEIMGLRHRSLPIEGVQFHPESALTECGIRIVENFLRRVRGIAQAVAV